MDFPDGYRLIEGNYFKLETRSGPYFINDAGVATPMASSGGGGGAVTIVDGGSVALGARNDTAATSDTGTFSLISLFKRAMGYWKTLAGVFTTVTITSAQTNATGANWTAFASLACTQLDIVNNNAAAIEYRRGAAGTAMPIPPFSARIVQGITNANQIDVRRVDQSNTQLTVQAEGYAA